MQLEATRNTQTAPVADSVRRCAVTRAHRPKDALLRFVLGPDGTIVPDLKAKLPGRGVWLTAAQDTVAEAVKRKAFSRALKAEAKAPADLPAQVERLLVEAALGALGMTNKACGVVFGYSNVEEALLKGRAVALIHARDAADDGCRKLDGKARSATNGAGVPIVRAFSANQLGLASGRANVIHAALINGGAARNFLAAASRLERYRKGSSAFADQNGLDTDEE